MNHDDILNRSPAKNHTKTHVGETGRSFITRKREHIRKRQNYCGQKVEDRTMRVLHITTPSSLTRETISSDFS